MSGEAGRFGELGMAMESSEERPFIGGEAELCQRSAARLQWWLCGEDDETTGTAVARACS